MNASIHGESRILTYLKGLPMAILQRLWIDTPSALAVYRLLPPAAHYTIMRLLLVRGAMPFEAIRKWHPASFRPTQNATLLLLKNLEILQGKAGEVWLNPYYRTSLIKAFSGNLEMTIEMGLMSNDEERPAATGGESAWEQLLFSMVTGIFPEQSGPLREVMIGSGLISSETGTITNVGFQFLLLPRYQQLWTLLLQFLMMAEASGLDLVACLISIFRLMLHPPGASAQSLVTQVTAKFLSQIGLVKSNLTEPPSGKHRSRDPPPNWVITELMDSLANPTCLNKVKTGFIIIETNYKFYAYTNSPLQIAILGLFVKLKDRFHNMVHGQLTGPSVQAALSKGITADQIIAFIKEHLHPSMQQDDGELLLPSVIEDQIHLWERDRKRLRMAEGYLYQEFTSEEQLKRMMGEAQRLNALLYVNYQKRILVVNEEAHPAMKAFVLAEKTRA